MSFLRATLLPLLTLFSLPFTSYALPASDAALPKSPQVPPLPVEVIYEFPPQTWVENLAVQSSGNILVTLIANPSIYQINPVLKTATLIHSFAPTYTSLLGIAELQPNIFYIAAGNFSPVTGTTPGSWSIFSLDLTSSSARIRKTADIPSAIFLNGVVALGRETLLIADSGAGLVYSLNVRTGKSAIAIDDPTMKHAPNSTPPIGVNGLKILRRRKELYFSNLQQGILARIPITSEGVAAGPAEVLSRDVEGTDDFALDRRGDAFVAQNGRNRLSFLARGNVTVLAGAPLQDKSLLAGPTAVAFGRLWGDRHTLYVTTSAGLASGANRTGLGGRLSRVDLWGWAWGGLI